jgi:hypothetical protein
MLRVQTHNVQKEGKLLIAKDPQTIASKGDIGKPTLVKARKCVIGGVTSTTIHKVVTVIVLEKR